jgi:predicted outer membrane repeat protein
MTFRAALAAAASSADASNTITFDPAVVAASTIALDVGKGPLAGFNQGPGRNLTIQGPVRSPLLSVASTTAVPVHAPATATAVFVSWLSFNGVQFDVSEPTALSLDHVQMSGYGKAVYMTAVRAIFISRGARLVATNSEFTNYADGGAIVVYGTASLHFCWFVSNSAVTGSSGGALSASLDATGSLLVRSCLFASNRAAREGGAIAVAKSGDSTVLPNVTISRSTFLSNSARYGGCIYASHVALEIVDSTFQMSTAQESGSALMTYCSPTTVARTSFTDNAVTQTSPPSTVFTGGTVRVWGRRRSP